MYISKEARIKDFQDVPIPPVSELFHRYGGSMCKSGTSAADDFENVVNEAERTTKLERVARGVDEIRKAAAMEKDGE